MFTFLSEDEAQSGCTSHRFSLLCLAAPGNISPVFQACFDNEIQSGSIRAGLAARYDFSKHFELLVAKAPSSEGEVRHVIRKGQELARQHLLFHTENRILCRIGAAKFDDGFGRNLNLLLRLGIKPGARLPLLLYEFPKSRDDEFAVLFGRFVGDVAECIEKYSRGPFVGLGGFSKCGLKFCLGHLNRIDFA